MLTMFASFLKYPALSELNYLRKRSDKCRSLVNITLLIDGCNNVSGPTKLKPQSALANDI